MSKYNLYECDYCGDSMDTRYGNRPVGWGQVNEKTHICQDCRELEMFEFIDLEE